MVSGPDNQTLPSPATNPAGIPAPMAHQVSDDGERAMASVTAATVADAVEALVGLGRDDWKVALVFTPGDDELAASGHLLQEAWPAVVIAGCTSAGLIDRHGNVGGRVQITLLGGPGFEARAVAAGLDGSTSREAGWVAAQAFNQLGHFSGPPGESQHQVLLLLVDGLTGDTNDIVRGAYDAVGASTPIVGGCAGDDLAMESTYQLTGSTVMTRSVVGVALRSTAPIGLGVRHGWTPAGQPMTVTSVEGTALLGLDDRPALDVYLEALGLSDEDITSRDLAVASQTRPLGLESRGGHHVRFVRGGDLERRSVEFLVALPEGELVTLMEGDTDSVIGAAGDAVEQAVAEIGGDPLGVIAFDCVACRGVIGDDQLDAEIDQVTQHLAPDAVVSGLYTYGEIARRGGALGFHNQTMVVLAVR